MMGKEKSKNDGQLWVIAPKYNHWDMETASGVMMFQNTDLIWSHLEI